ncbi:integration host factor subunit alpha [Geomonas subterranea]|nr:integration host factor subunit alpha [Geomonas subterranea]
MIVKKGITMTKADIVERLAKRNGFTKAESMDLVETVLDIMKTTLTNGEILKVSGFGSFIVKEKDDRRGRNPQTGEEITINARRVLAFKPSMVLKNAMNGIPTT